MDFEISKLQWTRAPKSYTLTDSKIEIITQPHTDLWQRTYYHFQNDNAPVLQMTTDEKFFSFTVKTEFESKHRFDQCGVVMYLDSDNWLKGSIEYENEVFQHLGSVVTNNGYSDWATTEISASIKSMWYRLSRREDDYCIECSADGVHYAQMRVCHMWQGGGTIQFGVYACSPEDSSFKATFTNMEVTECKWLAHDGQQPDVLHQMKLQPAPFAMIKRGQKTIELRLYDEKRQQVKVGDSILFTNTETGETLRTKVANLHCFDSFAELYKALPLLKCGYTEEDINGAQPADMEQYYSAHEQEKYGVVGIEICLL